MRNLKIAILAMLLTGCSSLTPYVAVRHLSDPGIDGDGWDIGCGGIKRRGQLEIKAGYCWNARGGNMLEASIEYELFGRKK